MGPLARKQTLPTFTMENMLTKLRRNKIATHDGKVGFNIVEYTTGVLTICMEKLKIPPAGKSNRSHSVWDVLQMMGHWL